LSYAALHRWWDQPFRLCSQLTERGLPSVTIKPCNSTVNEIFMFLRARVNKWHGKIPTTSRNDIIIFRRSSETTISWCRFKWYETWYCMKPFIVLNSRVGG
jgi:hypothetical protein